MSKRHFPLRHGEGITLAVGYSVLERLYFVMNDKGIHYGSANTNRADAWNDFVLIKTGSIYGSADFKKKKAKFQREGYHCEQLAVVRP